MPYPEIRAVGAITSGTAAIEPGLPAGLEVGDLLIGWFESGGATLETEANTALTAAGWASVGTEKKGNTRLTILSKIATTADLRVTNDTGDHQLGRLIAIKKGTFNEENPIPKSAFSTQAKTKAAKCPTIETAVAECLVFFAVSGNLPDAATTTEFSAETNGNLSEITERVDNTVTAGDGGALLVASGKKATAGVVGESTATAVTEAERVTATIAVAPYEDPGSPRAIASTKLGRVEQASAEPERPAGEAGDTILVTVYLEAPTKKISVAGGTGQGEQVAFGAYRMATFTVPWSNGVKVVVTWEGSEVKGVVVDLVTYRNVDATEPVEAISKWEEKASSIEPVAPAVTTKGTKRRVVVQTANGAGIEVNAWPTGTVGRINYSPAVCDVHQGAEGTSGTKTFHLVGAQAAVVQTLALKPKAAGGGSALVKELADGVTVSDALTRGVGKNISDSAQTSDSLTKATTKLLADTQAVTETIAKNVTKPIGDTATATDGVSMGVKKTLTDTVTVSDQLGTFLTLRRILEDTVAVADSMVRNVGKQLADAVTPTDSASRSTTKQLHDSVTVIDTLTRFTSKVLNDAVHLSDKITLPAYIGTFIRYLGKWVKVK